LGFGIDVPISRPGTASAHSHECRRPKSDACIADPHLAVIVADNYSRLVVERCNAPVVDDAARSTLPERRGQHGSARTARLQNGSASERLARTARPEGLEWTASVTPAGKRDAICRWMHATAGWL